MGRRQKFVFFFVKGSLKDAWFCGFQWCKGFQLIVFGWPGLDFPKRGNFPVMMVFPPPFSKHDFFLGGDGNVVQSVAGTCKLR